MRKVFFVSLAGLLCFMTGSFRGLAEESKREPQEPKRDEINLKERVEQLEEEVKELKKAPSTEFVQAALGTPFHLGVFVDTYYAFDFNEPPTMDRPYTTQPSRHNEFNVNLAYVEAKVAEERYRGRLAFQVGTSVDANYAAEPEDWAKFIQEAYVGYSPFKNLWIDAGIYFSHIGLESFISKDNWTYTRSLGADFSPYYQTGIRASYQWCKEWSTQLHFINGWQNISETNAAKAFGAQVAWQPSEHLALTYNNFVGKEVGDELRFFNDLVAKVSFHPVDVAFVYDIGMQERPFGGDWVLWQAQTLIVRYQIHRIIAIALRGEHYDDKEQVIVVTHTPNGFQTWGASANVDIQLHKNFLWRTEYRHFWASDNIFPTKSVESNNDNFVVSSLSLSF